MARKGLSVLSLAIVIVLLTGLPALASFTDVPDKRLSEKVNDLAQKNIINGFSDGTFRPLDPLTRAQMAKMISLAKGLPIVAPSSEYSSYRDVTIDHWASSYIEASSNAGIMKGYPDGTFRPNQKITRAELARMLRRSIDAKQINAVSPTYKDVTRTYWAFNEIEMVAHYQIMGGYKDGGFHPSDSATRGQTAIAVHKVISTEFPVIEESVNSDPKETTQTAQLETTITAANDGKIIICIDAGHGGKDPGAVAKSNGLKEKDVNLAVALKLQSILEGKVDKVIMTRTTDMFVELGTRAQIANNACADVFVSIHHNSTSTDTAAGTSVYSYPGSKAGSELAKLIQDELVKAFGWDDVKGKDDGALTANYAVLRQTAMTAALCESAYLSNPDEAAMLSTDDFRQCEADAISKGILKYVESNI